MAVYQTFVNAMNERIRRQIAVNNPFVFKHISNLKGINHFDDVGPCVVLASPGMMQNGLSRELFESWCADPKNGCIVAGYCVEGTLAKHILSEPEEITTMTGTRLPLRMHVSYISFSAHTDYKQTSGFIRALRPPHVVLVHGEANEMSRLKAALVREYEDEEIAAANASNQGSSDAAPTPTNFRPITFYNPRNTVAVELFFRGEKMAKVMGSLAEQKPEEGHVVSGILVKRNFNYHVVAPKDLTKYTDMTISTVTQKQSVFYKGSFALLHFMLSQLTRDIRLASEVPSDNDGVKAGDVGVLGPGEHPQQPNKKKTLKVFGEGIVTVTHERSLVTLEWVASPVNDMYADAVMCTVLQAESMESVPSYIPTVQTKPDKMHFKECLIEMLQDMFGEDSVPRTFSGDRFEVAVDSKKALIDLSTLEVSCEEDAVFLQMVQTAVSKLSTSLCY